MIVATSRLDVAMECSGRWAEGGGTGSIANGGELASWKFHCSVERVLYAAIFDYNDNRPGFRIYHYHAT